MIEPLETRRLLAASAALDNGIVRITGTPDADHIGLAVHIGNATNFLVVTAEGRQILAVPLPDVRSIAARLGAGDDVLKTDARLPRPVHAFGDGGNDSLGGGAGDDLLDGGAGDDVLLTGRGADDFVGGPGIDTVSYRQYAAAVRVTLDGLPNDGAAFNAVIQNALATPVRTEGDNVRQDVEIIHGGQGNDYIEGVTSLLAVVFPPARLEGGPGDDTLVAGHSAGRATLDGGQGNDLLIGGHQPNLLLGGPGDDRLIGNGGPDEFFGGTGFDTADYSGKARNLRITLDNIANDGEVGGASNLAENDNVHRDIERVIGGSGDDYIALSRSNTLTGAGSLNSALHAVPARIVFEGGPGNDTLVVDLPQLVATDPLARTSVALEPGLIARSSEFDRIDAGSNATALSSNATRVFAVLNGDAGNDRLVGSRLSDLLDGGDGSDTVLGNEGNDLIIASLGGDDLSGGAGIDTVNYSGMPAGVTVTIDGIANDGLAANLHPGPMDNVRLDIENVIGTQFADRITGSDRANRLDGLGGGDVIHGLGGNDTIVGGPGRDRLFGDAGNDLIISRDGEADLVDGGEGDDKAIADLIDELISIEGVGA